MASSGVRTAFSFYVQSCRMEFEREHPGEVPQSFKHFMQNCLTTWERMSAQEKEPFEVLEIAELRQQSGAVGDSPDSGKEKPSKKHKKEHRPPMYPRNAFYWYCQEHREEMQKKHPDTDPAKVALLLGRAWIATDPKEKLKYEQMSKQDYDSYLENSSTYP